METKKVGRYELVLKNNKTMDIIPVRINEFEKNYLATIDSYTITFETQKELIDDLKANSLLLQSLENLSDYELVIRYKVQGEYKYIPRRSDVISGIILKDKDRIKDIINTSLSEVTNSSNLKILGFYLIAIINKDFYNFLISNNLISERLKESTTAFLQTSSIQKIKDIKKELLRYKVVRGIVIGMLEFEKKYKISYYPDKKEEKKIIPVELNKFVGFIPEDIIQKQRKAQAEEEAYIEYWDKQSGYKVR